METHQTYAIGEQIVINNLRPNGYYHFEKKGTDFLADSTLRKILILVRTTDAPNTHSTLSRDEIQSLKARATAIHREAWIANVKIDNAQALVGSIEWLRLPMP